MTDKKYTNEEIMEALANCAFSAHNPDACKECHYNNVGAPICIAYCTKDALELMYRQESEIERLQKEVNLVSIQFQDLQERTYEIKAEAVKEFADLSIKRICEQVSAPTPSESYIVERCNQEINNLAKEMVGEENDQ